jgi:predicted lipoprotein with Yx(FWY)xxD motif
MNPSDDKQLRPSRRSRRSSLARALAGLTIVLAGTLAAVALASGASSTVTSASNEKLGKRIVVDAHGRTLYVLSPETVHHLLCKSSECLKFWPPLTVRSSKTMLKAGSGVHGRLATFRRNNGELQVTLGGLPLYRFAADHTKGEANGQGIHSFGGTWHVLSAKSSASPTPTTPTTPTTPSTSTTPSPSPGYGY